MSRYRIPIVIRALALFLASLPMARASVAGATAGHGMGRLPAHEAQAPAGTQVIRPVPEAVAATTIGAAVAGAIAVQRVRPHAATPARATRPVRAQAHGATQMTGSAPRRPTAAPIAVRVLGSGWHKAPVPSHISYLSTVQARAP